MAKLTGSEIRRMFLDFFVQKGHREVHSSSLVPHNYEAKYLDANGARAEIPARLTAEQAADVRRLAIEAFKACDLSGLARVDFLVNGDTGETFVNEVNTLPGFTEISQYPKLWEASGVSYPALLDRLIELAIERHTEKQQLKTSL